MDPVGHGSLHRPQYMHFAMSMSKRVITIPPTAGSFLASITMQSIGQALYEEVVYDDQGQLVTGTLMDYALPKASQIPWMELDRTETPSPVNPLGAKGIGESGTIGTTPAVQNAVIDAVAHLGVRHIDMPTTPQRVWTAINEAQKASHQ